MPKVVHISNDLRDGFYVNGELICQCEPYEVDIILRSLSEALGFEYEFRMDVDLEEFPEALEDD